VKRVRHGGREISSSFPAVPLASGHSPPHHFAYAEWYGEVSGARNLSSHVGVVLPRVRGQSAAFPPARLTAGSHPPRRQLARRERVHRAVYRHFERGEKSLFARLQEHTSDVTPCAVTFPCVLAGGVVLYQISRTRSNMEYGGFRCNEKPQ
jgi:hypothetical protein